MGVRLVSIAKYKRLPPIESALIVVQNAYETFLYAHRNTQNSFKYFFMLTQNPRFLCRISFTIDSFYAPTLAFEFSLLVTTVIKYCLKLIENAEGK